jgi:hypothetical protein
LSRDFRYTDDLGFERRCPVCHDWWPLALDFWDRRWSTRCRACIRAWKRETQNRRYREDEQYREDRKAAARLTAWKERVNEPERLSARRKAYEETRAERRRELQRLAYWARRDEILAKRRARRAA